jgi:tetratricopeptide (TPR) repeat protein
LDADREILERISDPYTRLRIVWLEAKIAAALGRLEEAEAAFRQARSGFIQERNGYDAAMASLDLAHLLTRQGRSAEVLQIAEEALPIFTADGVDPEAFATLTLLADAARQEGLTAGLVEELAGRLKKSSPFRPHCPIGSREER